MTEPNNDPAVPVDPFQKVFLVARIATLEMTVGHQTEALKSKESAISDMATQLGANAAKLSRLLAIPPEKINAAFGNVSSWLSKEDAARWSELNKSPQFIHAMSVALKTLILEAMHGGDEGPKQEKGPNG